VTRPAHALEDRVYPGSACRCLCRVNHPGTGAVCLELAGPPWAIPLTIDYVDQVAMCAPCRDATCLDRAP
jgi:hypothetical protein